MHSDSPDRLPPAGALPPVGRSQQKPRNRRALHVLLVSAPLVVVMIVCGALLLVLHFSAVTALKQVARGDLAAAQTTYERTVKATQRGPASWVAEYNLGTALIAQGQARVGIPWLEQAFEGVPKAIPAADGKIESYSYECQVRINLASGWESVGDGHYHDGQLGKAVETYQVAVDWSRPCELVGETTAGRAENLPDVPGEGRTPAGGQEDAGASTTERIAGKRASAERELTGEKWQETTESSLSGGEQTGVEPGGGVRTGEDPFGNETETERARREDLQEKNQRQTEVERERDESQNRPPGGRGW